MKGYFSYRFPPLSACVRNAATGPYTASSESGGSPLADQERALQQAIADGYQEGMERGYQDGFERGEVDGLAQGFEQGEAEGAHAALDNARRAVRAEFDGLADTLGTALQAVRKLHADYQEARRNELIELVAKVARQVVRCELALQPGQMLALVDEALGAMPATAEAPEVHLNPEECARLVALLPERASHWTLVPDAALAPGECRVKAGGHEADAGCAHRLEACMEQVGRQLNAASVATLALDGSSAPDTLPAAEPAIEEAE
ncbi:flagellar assembly protein FliH [Pandoraea pulmonicola]|uniref:Flagellar assembly protein FliH n=1 Tax=Pandoraea pulmonicola TaxID=93221 RepID=A0AAJ4ZB48_PANPU|nr:flagellar assembly protein FliH [Pandoraea pulmonicola]APD13339.1 hypothetical protein RO07_13315 [Pandoraea pulmonicola]SUA90103.1 flagellar assembly protein H [Pandoraea pulmonicola]